MEFTLLFAALVGLAAAWLSARLLARSGRHPIPDNAFDLILNAAVVGVLVGRVWSMVAAGTNPVTNPGDLIVIRGGVDPLGASLGAMGTLLWATRRDGWATLDEIAPVALWGLSGWHAGCVITGACLGVATSLPWAFSAAGSDVGRHPVELYTALLLAAGALVLSRLRTSRPGLVAALAVLVAGAARLMTEPLRLALGGGRMSLYVAGVIGAAIVSVAVARRGQTGTVPTPHPDGSSGSAKG